MTQGFYEQFGLDAASSPREIRSAWVRVVGQIRKRRKAVVEQGGDASRLDQHRQQVDEAWAVLSDPVRRRRYDAFLALQQQGWTTDSDEVWRRAAGALVSPAAAAAAEVLRVGTGLAVGALPPAPRPHADDAPEAEERTVTSSHRTSPTVVPAVTTTDDEPERSGSIVNLPTARADTPAPAFRVVDGSERSAPVIVMPTPAAPPMPAPRNLDAGGIADLVDRFGWSGSLLREVRVARGLSLQEMCDSSRISVRYLEAVEQDDYEKLPSPTFVRGYVREMGRLLDLDEARLVEGYMKRLAGDA